LFRCRFADKVQARIPLYFGGEMSGSAATGNQKGSEQSTEGNESTPSPVPRDPPETSQIQPDPLDDVLRPIVDPGGLYKRIPLPQVGDDDENL
jgi:hypothetical protein